MVTLRLWLNKSGTYAFVILQLTVVLVVTILGVSSIYERFAQYLPLRKVLNQNGAIVFSLTGYRDKFASAPYQLDFRHAEPLSEDFSPLHECWYTQYNVYLHSEAFQNLDVIGYDRNVIDLYKPRLIQGNWEQIMHMTQTSDGNLPAIICQNGFDYKIGDTIELKTVTYENARLSAIVEVMGIMDVRTQIFGGNTNGSGITYESFFSTPSDNMPQEEPYLMILLPMNAVDAANLVAYYREGYSLMLYPQDLSDKESAILTSMLQTKYDSYTEPLSSVQVKSKQYLRSQMLTVFPILICLLCMVLMSAVCTNAVVTYRSMRQNGIFEICGATKAQCILMNLMQMCLSIGISILLSCVIIFVCVKKFKLQFTFNLISALLCGLICCLVIALSILLPAKLISKTHPKNLLKAE